MLSMSLRGDLARRLAAIPTCTAIDVLLADHRVDDYLMRDIEAIQFADKAVAGPVRTLRFLPARADLSAHGPEGLNFKLIDSVETGDVLVFDTVRGLGGSVLGDMLALRAARCGAAAVVTDGAVRDLQGLETTGLPVFAARRHATPYRGTLFAFESDVPVQCGGVAVLPTDWVLADRDAVLVLPAAAVSAVLERAGDTLSKEVFCRALLEQGAPLSRAYPLKPWAQSHYEAFLRSGDAPRYAHIAPAEVAGEGHAAGAAMPASPATT